MREQRAARPPAHGGGVDDDEPLIVIQIGGRHGAIEIQGADGLPGRWRDAQRVAQLVVQAALRQQGLEFIGDDQHPRRHVLDDIGHLLGRQPPVDRHHDRAQLGGCAEQVDIFQAVGGQYRQPVTLAHACGRQTSRQARRALGILGVRDPPNARAVFDPYKRALRLMRSCSVKDRKLIPCSSFRFSFDSPEVAPAALLRAETPPRWRRRRRWHHRRSCGRRP